MMYAKFIRIGFLVFATLMLAACTPKDQKATEFLQTATEIAVVTETTSNMASEVSTTATDEIDVEALIIEKTAGHHDTARIFNANKTREEWNATLDRMIQYGAKISDEEKEIIINYLLNR